LLLSKAWASVEVDKRIEGFSPQTLMAYLLQILLLIDYLKDVEIELLETNQLKEYLAMYGKHLKPASLTSYPFNSFVQIGYITKLISISKLAEINKEIHPHQRNSLVIMEHLLK